MTGTSRSHAASNIRSCFFLVVCAMTQLSVVDAVTVTGMPIRSSLRIPASLPLWLLRKLVVSRKPAGFSNRIVSSIHRGGSAMDDEGETKEDEHDEDDIEGEEEEVDDEDEEDHGYDNVLDFDMDYMEDVSDEDEDDGDNNAPDFDEFDEETDSDHFVEAWKSTPPLTKGYLLASLAATLCGFLTGRNEFPSILTLDWTKVRKSLQIWRPLTAFLNFGPFGTGYLVTARCVWFYMSSLERLNSNRPYDFWIMIVFGQLSMLVAYTLLRLHTSFLGHNLSTFLVYIWSRYHMGVEVNVFGFFNIRAEMVPWVLLAQTYLVEREPPICDFLGICFGHLYHDCFTVGILRAPKSFTKWYETSGGAAKRIRKLYKPDSSARDKLPGQLA